MFLFGQLNFFLHSCLNNQGNHHMIMAVAWIEYFFLQYYFAEDTMEAYLNNHMDQSDACCYCYCFLNRSNHCYCLVLFCYNHSSQYLSGYLASDFCLKLNNCNHSFEAHNLYSKISYFLKVQSLHHTHNYLAFSPVFDSFQLSVASMNF